jgi:NhaP-type Na+/H+ or K+/H+ antiporter
LRFSLTGEAGLNDGTAFPFVMLGLGLLGLHEIGDYGWRWLAVDVGWATLGGIGTGALLGTLVGRFVLYLRRERKEGVGLDDLLALGLIAFSYGIALMIHSYGFLAVFAAGVALRRVERHAGSEEPPPQNMDEVMKLADTEEVATHPETAPTFMAQALLSFNEQMERIGEVAVVVVLGGLLSWHYLPFEALWFVPLLLLVVRPVAVLLGLIGSRTSGLQRGMISWFGIRGIGSIYYLMYAIEHHLPFDLAERLTALTLVVVTISIVVHGISVTPLMNRYGKQTEGE